MMWCEHEVLKPAAETFQVPVKNCSGSVSRSRGELSALSVPAWIIALPGFPNPAILSRYL